MEIIRSRLCDRDFFSVENFPKMVKTRTKGDKCMDIQPCRAKRKLFEDPPSHLEGSDKRTGETVHSLRLKVEGVPVERFTDFEVFEEPPYPYRTVTHLPRSVARLDSSRNETVGETEPSARVAECSHTVSQRQSSPRTGQAHLQDYFKPKKRPRLAQQHKTPVTRRQRKSECTSKEEDPPSGDGV